MARASCPLIIKGRQDAYPTKGYQEWEQETREKLAIGLAQVEQGEVIDGDVVMARLHEKIRQARENQK